MTIGIRQRLDGTHHLDIKADNIRERYDSNQKLLGLHIDENLNWNTHIDNLSKVVSSKISLLQQLTEYVPLQGKKKLTKDTSFRYLITVLSLGDQNLLPILKVYQNYRNEQRG